VIREEEEEEEEIAPRRHGEHGVLKGIKEEFFSHGFTQNNTDWVSVC
jgi:hypothetical protein